VSGYLSTDVDAVARVKPDGLMAVVWEKQDGELTSRLVDEDDRTDLRGLLAGARRAAVVSCMIDQRHPLLVGVLPDADGVLRARWTAE
jgi:small subunit ribosomal protein S1